MCSYYLWRDNMKTVYKYVLNATAIPIDVPVGAEILTVAGQYDEACLWAIVDTDAATEQRWFMAVGTGQEVPAGNVKYIGTCLFMDGAYVLHYFELL
jgi:hypothetical protein